MTRQDWKIALAKAEGEIVDLKKKLKRAGEPWPREEVLRLRSLKEQAETIRKSRETIDG